jgi:hypothetical protein
MYGISAFAQAPYAALGGPPVIELSIVEGMTLADLSTQLSTFLQSIVEDSVLADTPTRLITFPLSVTESILSGDFNTQYTAYKPTFVENVSMGENTRVTGWSIINTAQGVVWTKINTSS